MSRRPPRRPARCARCRRRPASRCWSPSRIPTCRRPRQFREAAELGESAGWSIHAALFHVEDEPPFDLAEPLAHE
eukprot:3770014-Heterocapsa_arctica.AAC.1